MQSINHTEVSVSTDLSTFDINMIHRFLTKSYWAQNRTLKEVKISMENCINFGLFLKDNQVGFARVLTDKVVFAYIMDVFILETYQGNGLSHKLMESIISHDDISGVRRLFLATKDAHGLYEKYGFEPLEKPEMWMERLLDE